MVVVAIVAPRARRHITHFDELPVRHISRPEAEIISHRWRNVQPRAPVQIWLRPLVLEDVLKMVRPKRPAVFPLGVTGFVSLANGEPAAVADGLAFLCERLLEPGNYQARLGLETPARDIVIRKGDVKRILPGNKRDWYVISARGRVGIVVAAKIIPPVAVPGAFRIRHRVVGSRLFADPETPS